MEELAATATPLPVVAVHLATVKMVQMTHLHGSTALEQSWSRLSGDVQIKSLDKCTPPNPHQLPRISAFCLRLPLSNLRHLTFMLLVERLWFLVVVRLFILPGWWGGWIVSSLLDVKWNLQSCHYFTYNTGQFSVYHYRLTANETQNKLVAIDSSPADVVELGRCPPQRADGRKVSYYTLIFLMEIYFIRRQQSFC